MKPRPDKRCTPLLLEVVIVGALALSYGCGRTARWDLSGRVTYSGQPIAEGHIAFEPIQPGTGGGFARIVDGKYDTRHQGRNHSGGPHRVTIVGYKGLKNPKNPDSDVLLAFPPYVTEVDLPRRSTTLDFNVPATWGQSNLGRPSR